MTFRYFITGIIFITLLTGLCLYANPHSDNYTNSHRKIMHAVRVSSPPEIDGNLDDPVWQKAEPATGFIQYEPHNDRPASQETSVKVLYDDRALVLDTGTDQTRHVTTQPFTNYNLVVADQTLRNNSFVSLINTNVTGAAEGYTANVTGTEFRFFDNSNLYSIRGSGAVSPSQTISLLATQNSTIPMNSPASG